MRRRWMVLLTVWLVMSGSALAQSYEEARALIPVIRTLRPLHKRLGSPQPGDWLSDHKEDGQTFTQYVRTEPIVAGGERIAVYVMPLGEFTPEQREIVELTGIFMSRFLDLSLVIMPDVPLSVIPEDARRPGFPPGAEQIKSTYVLYDLLQPQLPADAVTLMAFTASDLYAGPRKNHLAGQAGINHRVAVWSLYSSGDPSLSEESYRMCLLRTLKTAVHELGHIFTMRHCTAYECGMCGTGSQEEADRLPLWFCPECMAKVCWATGADPAKRYEDLAEFCEEHGLEEEAAFYRKSLQALGEAEP